MPCPQLVLGGTTGRQWKIHYASSCVLTSAVGGKAFRGVMGLRRLECPAVLRLDDGIRHPARNYRRLIVVVVKRNN